MIRFRKNEEIYNGCYIKVDGSIIINPTEDMLLRHGYKKEEYTPEEVPQTEPDSGEVLEQIKSLLQGDVEKMDDKAALEKPALFPSWASQDGKELGAGKRVWFNGKLYRVVKKHIVRADRAPSVYTTDLYAEVTAMAQGTKENPVMFQIGMSLQAGLYYKQHNVLYRCIAPVQNCQQNLSAIKGRYVETVSEAAEPGTKENPLVIRTGMTLVAGKYYQSQGQTYLCVKGMSNCQYSLDMIVGNYVRKV